MENLFVNKKNTSDTKDLQFLMFNGINLGAAVKIKYVF